MNEKEYMIFVEWEQKIRLSCACISISATHIKWHESNL